MVEFVLLVLTLFLSPTLGWWLRRRHGDWSSWRVILLAALPLPAFVASITALAFVASRLVSSAGCGADCNSATAVGVTGLIIAPVLLGLCAAFAGLGVFFARRTTPREPDVGEIFE
jgi:hypothetical protein